MRLRTACISSLYKKSMKSTITHPIAPHQILSFANEESEIIMKMVENGAAFFGTIFGVIWCFIAVVVLLGAAGMYPLFGVVLLFIIVVSCV